MKIDPKTALCRTRLGPQAHSHMQTYRDSALESVLESVLELVLESVDCSSESSDPVDTNGPQSSAADL